MAVNVYASATEDGAPDDWVEQVGSAAGTIDCPDVGSGLTEVPEGAREGVDKELAALDQQIAEAYQRLQNSLRAQQQDGGFADDAIMNPLKEKRAATIERIAIAIDRVGDRPEGLDSLAACELRPAENQNAGQNGGEQNGGEQNGGGQNGDGGQNRGDQGGQGQQGNGGQAGNGPVAADYADIRSVQPNTGNRGGENGSTGSFSTDCGVNANGLFNSDNVIVAPGVSNGAHHFHDYVGNQGNSAFAGDEDLAAADTSCENQGDRSSYFWPVIRLQNGTAEQDANAPGGGIEGNAGEIVTPKDVTMTFVGSPRGEVVEMPRLLRIITGDAKAFINGPANANASWSCTGFEDRQLKDKYPLCPSGSDVVRTFEFQSCWDGRNIDSANHRTHVAFAAADGSCAAGFKAIPQLVQRIVYDVDAPSLQDGGRTTPLFAVDSFPEQLHKPGTDHGDFINVFDEDLMRAMVDCVNDGRECDAADLGGDQGDGDAGQGDGGDQGGDAGQGDGQGQDDGQDQGQDHEQGQDQDQDQEQPGNGQGDGDGDDQGQGDQGQDENAAEPTETAQAPGSDDQGDQADETGKGDQADETGKGGDKEPQVLGSVKATQRGNPADSDSAADGDKGGNGTGTGTGGDANAAPGQTPAANVPSAAGQPGAQGPGSASGSLAETGSQLWPAMIGGVAVLAGVVLLRRVRRGTY
ncbi:DUF1996 domain-containing protein [Streptomyces sp. FxanaA7]|uniref:DUF1996 domain-containing protein n=1 Tax=Streptomyces sp. FxanaA7 TaxID=1265492 RepID=UPI0005F08F05|nr:DUF1996 domain-containing protein [Streptomyces sp. FxanaA7]